MDVKAAWEQLSMLRELTRTTGCVHEAQVQHLKLWPLVIYGPASSTFTMNIELKRISYDVVRKKLRTKDKKVPQFRGDRAASLAEWTQALLGSEWTVDVLVRGIGKRTEKTFGPVHKMQGTA